MKSKWGQDADRIAELRSKESSDIDRWSKLDSHNEGWVNRATLAAQFISPNSKIVELGAGRAFLRTLAPAGCTYIPTDLVAHEPDFLVIDLNSDGWTLPQSDFTVALGTFEYIYNLQELFNKLSQSAKKILFTYCCRVEGSDVNIRLRQGWLNDFRSDEIEAFYQKSGYTIVRKLEFQKELYFVQTMWLVEIDKTKENCETPHS